MPLFNAPQAFYKGAAPLCSLSLQGQVRGDPLAEPDIALPFRAG